MNKADKGAWISNIVREAQVNDESTCLAVFALGHQDLSMVDFVTAAKHMTTEEHGDIESARFILAFSQYLKYLNDQAMAIFERTQYADHEQHRILREKNEQAINTAKTELLKLENKQAFAHGTAH